MKLYLGIDGGQSSTTALIGDETGKVLGEGRSGPCNHVGEAERRDKFFAAVGDSVRLAAQQAGVNPLFEGVCAGFSGGAEDKDALTRELIRADRYLITHDAHIALAGAAAGEPGIVVIAGTGSIAYGRNEDGNSARAGGWGYVFGDEGGAFDIARQAVRAIVRQEEGWGQPTMLRDVLLGASGCESANQLLHRCYTAEYPRERVAAWAAIVDEVARTGDPVAMSILDGAAQALAMIASAVRRRLFTDGESANIYPIGGTFASEPLLERFRMLAELVGENSVLTPRMSPLQGALLEARTLGR
ncbi:MAG: BadF/BadG/BcrA/BcrD ATPase family protein [Bryobacteraceae bacterium]